MVGFIDRSCDFKFRRLLLLFEPLLEGKFLGRLIEREDFLLWRDFHDFFAVGLDNEVFLAYPRVFG